MKWGEEMEILQKRKIVLQSKVSFNVAFKKKENKGLFVGLSDDDDFSLVNIEKIKIIYIKIYTILLTFKAMFIIYVDGMKL